MFAVSRTLVEDVGESTTRKTTLDREELAVLLKIYSTHHSKFAEHIAFKTITSRLPPKADSRLVNQILQFEDFHCYSQACKLVHKVLETQFPSDLPISTNDVFKKKIIAWIVKFSDRPPKNLVDCERHCECQIASIYRFLIAQSVMTPAMKTSLYSQVLASLKRCQLLERVQISSYLLNPSLPKFKFGVSDTKEYREFVSSWTRKNMKILFSMVSNNQVTFGSHPREPDQQNNLDIVMLRSVTLLGLQANTFQAFQREERFQAIKSEVLARIKLASDDEQEGKEFKWLTQLFIEDDDKLILAIFTVLQLYQAESNLTMSNKIFDEFLAEIHHDVDVLIDWLCSDEETAVILLTLLLAYIRGSTADIPTEDQTKNVIVSLYKKIESLSSKKLFPYNANPLLDALRRFTLTNRSAPSTESLDHSNK